jgi:hypothetical protein
MPPSSGSASCLLHAGFLFGLLFNVEDGGDTFLQNNGSLSPNKMALNTRRQHPLESPL